MLALGFIRPLAVLLNVLLLMYTIYMVTLGSMAGLSYRPPSVILIQVVAVGAPLLALVEILRRKSVPK